MSTPKPNRRRGPKPRPVPDRLWAKVDRAGPDECWLWTGGCFSNGYGCLHGGRDADGRKFNLLAHRVAYELLVGPIPEGLTLDHLCRNPPCVNPDHLEPVTMRENLMRGGSPSALAVGKTHCPQGHPYDEANTMRRRGKRECKTCHRDRERRRRKAVTLTPEELRLAYVSFKEAQSLAVNAEARYDQRVEQAYAEGWTLAQIQEVIFDTAASE